MRAKIRYSFSARTPQGLLAVVWIRSGSSELNTTVRFFERVNSTLSRRWPLGPLIGPKRWN